MQRKVLHTETGRAEGQTHSVVQENSAASLKTPTDLEDDNGEEARNSSTRAVQQS